MTYIVPVFWLLLDFDITVDDTQATYKVERPLAVALTIWFASIWPWVMVTQIFNGDDK
jgi:hypothetical protein